MGGWCDDVDVAGDDELSILRPGDMMLAQSQHHAGCIRPIVMLVWAS